MRMQDSQVRPSIDGDQADNDVDVICPLHCRVCGVNQMRMWSLLPLFGFFFRSNELDQ